LPIPTQLGAPLTEEGDHFDCRTGQNLSGFALKTSRGARANAKDPPPVVLPDVHNGVMNTG
jgi:hypothetical protein